MERKNKENRNYKSTTNLYSFFFIVGETLFYITFYLVNILHSNFVYQSLDGVTPPYVAFNLTTTGVAMSSFRCKFGHMRQSVIHRTQANTTSQIYLFFSVKK